jgi:hypothetical protein
MGDFQFSRPGRLFGDELLGTKVNRGSQAGAGHVGGNVSAPSEAVNAASH